MAFRISSLLCPRRTAPLTPAPRPRFRPVLEGYEDRVVPAAPALAPAQAAPVQVAPTFNLGALQLNLGDVHILNNNGVNSLVGTARIGNVSAPVPINLTATPNAQNPAGTPILDLELAPIHLNLLGLNVDTSRICLDITAVPGSGNLLGNLLGDVANLLNNGTSLSNILGGLTAVNPTTLTSGLNQILGGLIGSLPAATVAGVSGTTPGATNILNLSVGPLNLNLLGLNVALDNCAGGPVTVDITAQSGPGQLLGNLLGGLSHLLDSSASGTALANKINTITGEIEQLIGSL